VHLRDEALPALRQRTEDLVRLALRVRERVAALLFRGFRLGLRVELDPVGLRARLLDDPGRVGLGRGDRRTRLLVGRLQEAGEPLRDLLVGVRGWRSGRTLRGGRRGGRRGTIARRLGRRGFPVLAKLTLERFDLAGDTLEVFPHLVGVVAPPDRGELPPPDLLGAGEQRQVELVLHVAGHRGSPLGVQRQHARSLGHVILGVESTGCNDRSS
jgi:hypothetical protein